MENRAKHIAVIMDGNGRWAQSFGLPRSAGHKAGAEIIEEVAKAAMELDIECLTLYGLSTDNLKRPKGELDYLLKLACESLERYVPNMAENGIQLRFIGDVEALGDDLYNKVQWATEVTKYNSKLILVIALNFSGRWHILNTAKKLLSEGKELSDTEISREFDSLLPSPPDILIRTGGNHRLSDFIMYHLAYSELYFLDVKWPDFEKRHFIEVLDSFNKVERRFGKIKEGV